MLPPHACTCGIYEAHGDSADIRSILLVSRCHRDIGDSSGPEHNAAKAAAMTICGARCRWPRRDIIFGSTILPCLRAPLLSRLPLTLLSCFTASLLSCLPVTLLSCFAASLLSCLFVAAFGPLCLLAFVFRYFLIFALSCLSFRVFLWFCFPPLFRFFGGSG